MASESCEIQKKTGQNLVPGMQIHCKNMQHTFPVTSNMQKYGCKLKVKQNTDAP